MDFKAKAITVISILLCLVLVVASAENVRARANIEDYLNQQYGAPNGFEPAGWNTTGTATWLDVQLTGGWKHMTCMGNLGIGNGSIATFGDKDSLPVNQSDPYFMGADVSQQPLDPVRQLNLNVVSPATEETNTSENNTTAAANTSTRQPSKATSGNTTDSSSIPPFLKPTVLQTLQLPADQGVNETASNETAANVTTSETPASLTPENLTYSAYHPISIGASANDLLYEHPLATSVSMYCRLIGLEVPGSSPINIGMKCLGYGY